MHVHVHGRNEDLCAQALGVVHVHVHEFISVRLAGKVSCKDSRRPAAGPVTAVDVQSQSALAIRFSAHFPGIANRIMSRIVSQRGPALGKPASGTAANTGPQRAIYLAVNSVLSYQDQLRRSSKLSSEGLLCLQTGRRHHKLCRPQRGRQ